MVLSSSNCLSGISVTDTAGYQPLPPLEPEELRLPDILQALADQNRLMMVQRLSDGEWHAFGVDAWGGLHKSTVSHHWRALREAGLVEYRIVGRNKDARLRRAAVDSRFPGLLDGVLSSEAKAALPADPTGAPLKPKPKSTTETLTRQSQSKASDQAAP